MVIFRGSSSSNSSSISSSSSQSQACASCKYQRRRCTADCLLAPHFPADQPKIFQNAHRLFGVANMSRILKQIKEEERDDAMQSIKFESNMWQRFPYYGCWAVICQLRQELEVCKNELDLVRSLIDMIRDRGGTNNEFMPECALLEPSSSKTLIQQQQQALLFEQSRRLMQRRNQFEEDYRMDVKPFWSQKQIEDIEAQYDAIAEALVADDDDDDDNDDPQKYNGTKEPCNSSNGSNLKSQKQKSVKDGSQNELKNAAAWFGLTSIN